MKTQTTLGSFIALMLTLAEQESQSAGVVNHPQSDVVPLRPLVTLMTINLSRPAIEDNPAGHVFRFCSSRTNNPSSTLLPSSPPVPTALECHRTHTGLSKRRVM